MIPSDLIRRILRQWQIWRDKRTAEANYRRLMKTNPELRRFEEAEADAIRQHRPVRYIRQAKQDYVTSLLRERA